MGHLELEGDGMCKGGICVTITFSAGFFGIMLAGIYRGNYYLAFLEEPLCSVYLSLDGCGVQPYRLGTYQVNNFQPRAIRSLFFDVMPFPTSIYLLSSVPFSL